MSASQRRKGKAGELELVRLLREHLGADVARHLAQARDGGVDLLGLPGWAIEVKRANRPRLAEWWLQTCMQAEVTGLRPALFYRLDRQPWRVVIALRHVAKGELYLLSTPTLEAVNSALTKGDTGLNIRPRALWRQCQQRGWLQAGDAIPGGGERTSRVVWIAGKAERVLVFNASALES